MMNKRKARMGKLLIAVLLIALTVGFAAGCAKREPDHYGTTANDYFYNPVKVDAMLGDPWMVKQGDYYYYTHSNGNTVTLAKSKTMTGIMAATDEKNKVLFRSASLKMFWAPEVFFYQNRWYCYFTATTGSTDEQVDKNRRTYCLVSKTEDAMGDWDFAGEIVLPDDQWSIDATFFENSDGRIYIIWSGWENDSMYQVWKQDLYISELETGNPAKAKEGTTRVMISEPTYSWETSVLPQNEGAEILKGPDGSVYLVYSGNFSGSDSYCLAYLKLSGDPMEAASWTKSAQPLLSTSPSEKIYSPGHCSFVKSPDGTEDWVVYHAAKKAGTGWDRVVRLQKIEWKSGALYLGTPAPINSKVSLPSGEKIDRRLFEAEDAAFSEGASTVSRKGTASGDTAVKFKTFSDEIVFTVQVDRAGRYPVYVRCANSGQTNGQIYLDVNGSGSRPVFAPMTPGLMYFYMTSVTVDLQAGLNTIVLTSAPGIDIDCIFIDYQNV